MQELPREIKNIKIMSVNKAVKEIKNNTIKLDYDNKKKKIKVTRVREGYKIFVPNALEGMNFSFIARTGIDQLSKTKNGYHIEIPKVASDLQILALQIIMGSDIDREYYNMQRLCRGEIHNWNVLFKKKYERRGGKIVKTSQERNLL